MFFFTVLFVIVLLLLAYALSADKGKHTIHARQSKTHTQTASVHRIGGDDSDAKAAHAN